MQRVGRQLLILHLRHHLSILLTESQSNPLGMFEEFIRAGIDASFLFLDRISSLCPCTFPLPLHALLLKAWDTRGREGR